MAGLIFARYIIRFEPVASMPSEGLVVAIGPTVQRYLTEPLPAPAVPGHKAVRKNQRS
jgi:hypothetical protein